MKKIFTLALTALALLSGGTMKAQNELVVGDVKVGDLIKLSDDSEWYVGVNEITNGSFDADPAKNNGNIVGWTNGTYAPMTTSTFLWFAEGGYDGGAYIQANKHTGAAGDGSIGQRWSIQPQTRYYFSFYLKKNSKDNQYIPVVSITANESTAGGQNEHSGNGGSMIIGKNGGEGVTDDVLGFGAYDENGGWAQTACSFESGEYTYLQFNARWLKENAIQACFDGFFLAKLYDPEETTQSMVAFLALQAKLEEVANIYYEDYECINAVLSDFPSTAEINGTPIGDLTEESELTDIQAAIDACTEIIEDAEAAAATLASFNTLLEEANALATDTNYPGIDAFNSVIDDLTNNYKSGGYYSQDITYSDLEYAAAALAALQKAIDDYRTSQVATEENPADYTFLIDNPKFVAQGKWYIGQSGGDQRLHTGLTDNDGNPMTAWNAWRNNLTDATQSVSINQDLTGLPNGYYTVTADMCTQDGCITDQHVFANGTAQSSVSPVMTVTGWDPWAWETLTTAKVLVVDGKLTIGAIGHGDADTPDMHGGTNTDARRGWFCISNFKLNYLGEASGEDIANITAQKYADAQALVDALHLAKDKADLTDSIADAKEANELDKVNRVIAMAEASEAEYNGIMTGSYKTLQDNIASEEEGGYSADAKALAQVPVQYMTDYLGSAAATYTETGAITTVLRAYRDNLIPALQKAETKQSELTSAEGKALIADAITYVKNKLATYTADTKVIDEQVKVLNDAVAASDLYEIEVKDGADLTAYLQNATCDNTGTKDKPAGWTTNLIDSQNGQYTSTGQAVDGGTAHYLDAWNGTAGKLRYTAYQVLNVPNGTYTLSNIMRTSGAGAYLFVSDKAPVKNEEEVETLDATANNLLSEAVVKPTDYKYFYETEKDPETGEVIGRITEAKNATDSYGEIWCAAADELMAKADVTEATETASIWSAVSDVLQGSTETVPAGVDEETWKIFAANNGIGRGWFNNKIENIVVTNHTLVIGISSDYVFLNKTEEEKFQGTWFSADNFKLTLVTEGNNEGWNPTTGIADVEAPVAKTSTAIFNIAGQQVDKSYKGIVIKNGKKYLQK